MGVMIKTALSSVTYATGRPLLAHDAMRYMHYDP